MLRDQLQFRELKWGGLKETLVRGERTRIFQGTYQTIWHRRGCFSLPILGFFVKFLIN